MERSPQAAACVHVRTDRPHGELGHRLHDDELSAGRTGRSRNNHIRRRGHDGAGPRVRAQRAENRIFNGVQALSAVPDH